MHKQKPVNLYFEKKNNFKNNLDCEFLKFLTGYLKLTIHFRPLCVMLAICP